LAALPVIDAVLNQAGNVADVRIWSMSVFQAVRGMLLLLNLVLLATALSAGNRPGFRPVAVVFLYPLALTCSGVLEAAGGQGIRPESVVAILQ
jgi:hypothetical protein